MKKILNITIIGLGHIGGSLASSLKNTHGKKVSIIGIDNSPSVIRQALKSGFFSEVSTLRKSKTISESNVIFVSVSIRSIPLIFSELIKVNFKHNIIITDVGSVKEEIFNSATKILPEKFEFVGGHPIAGTEKTGFKNLVSGLFENKPVFISGVRAKNQSIGLIKNLWKSLGCLVYSIPPSEHDKIFGHLSHLPHVLAFGLKNIANKKLTSREILKYGGTSYKDYSRISESSEALWSEIFLSNRKNLIKGIKEFRVYLDKLESLLESNSKEKTEKHLKS